jgi:hypothetical protein
VDDESHLTVGAQIAVAVTFVMGLACIVIALLGVTGLLTLRGTATTPILFFFGVLLMVVGGILPKSIEASGVGFHFSFGGSSKEKKVARAMKRSERETERDRRRRSGG